MTTLEEDVAKLFTMKEALDWIAEHHSEFGLARAPRQDTLKTASRAGRLKSVIKGGIFFTRESELRDYMAHFDPKNKTESRPVKPRAVKARQTRAAIAAGDPIPESSVRRRRSKKDEGESGTETTPTDITPKRRGRKPKTIANTPQNTSVGEAFSLDTPPQNTATTTEAAPKRRGRKPKTAQPTVIA